MYYDAPICWRERHDAWSDEQRGHLFSYLSPEQRVPVVHPLRTIRAMSDDVLRRLSPRFDAIYAATGRPSIPPEQLATHVVAAGAVLGPERADADGAAGIQPAVSAGDWDRRTRYGDEPLAGLPPRRVTIGGDKGYETCDFVKSFRT
jgi:hypothetical protein